MKHGNIRYWQEFVIAGAVIAILQLIVLPPLVYAAVDGIQMKSPVEGISTLAVAPGTTGATGVCIECTAPAPIRERIAGLVITTTLTDGGYVAVWQNKYDNLVYVQRYSLEGDPNGAPFRIDTEVKDGLLPVILNRKEGGFVAIWQQDGHRHEQHFNSRGMAMENEAQPK